MAWHPWILKDLRTDVTRCWNLALSAKQYAEVNVAALRELARQYDRMIRELDARVTALESQPPTWLPKNRHVEL